MVFWSQSRGVKLHFIQPGKPTQKAFVESFNGKFRDTCLRIGRINHISVQSGKYVSPKMDERYTP